MGIRRPNADIHAVDPASSRAFPGNFPGFDAGRVEVLDVAAGTSEAVTPWLEIVDPLFDEPLGVRRFFVRARHGVVVDAMTHRSPG